MHVWASFASKVNLDTNRVSAGLCYDSRPGVSLFMFMFMFMFRSHSHCSVAVGTPVCWRQLSDSGNSPNRSLLTNTNQHRNAILGGGLG